MAPELLPCAVTPAASRGRRHPEPEHALRNPYQRDRDRVVHSTAFRRLEYKTQVFVNHEGDHYRTRLTHTLEVAQIARTIARSLGLNEDLTEAVALAHDLGHTPFGHSGEEALDSLMREHGGAFEHNRHGLRVVDVLERRYPDFDGLNLTYEVREAFVRHSTSYDKPAATDETADEFPKAERVHLEGQVVCLADSIAYDTHDLDDGLVSGLLDERDLDRLAVWRRARALAPDGPRLDQKMLRHAIVRRLIDLQVGDIVETSRRLIAESGVRSLEEVRRHGAPLVAMGEDLRSEIAELERFLRARLYRHFRVMRMANKAKRMLEEMFREFLGHREDLPDEHSSRADDFGLAQVVCDYLAGMTDRYAQDTYRRLFQPFERM